MSLLIDQDDMATGSSDELDMPGAMPTSSTPKTAPAHTTSFPINGSEHEPPSSSQVSHLKHSNSHSLTSHHSLPQLLHGPYSTRYFPRHPSYRLTRDDLRDLASSTLDTLDRGVYWPPGKREGLDEPYDLKKKIKETITETAFYAPDDEVLSGWSEGTGRKSQAGSEEADTVKAEKTRIVIGEYSTLVGARKLYEMVNAGKGDQDKKERVGVLNFASAKKPGGGFINGAQAQEESIARSSTLYPALLTPAAKHFYRFYAEDPDNAFYTHAMVYSPSIIVFRGDKGDFRKPIEIDVLTSAAVNAGDVRKQVRWEEEMRELRERVRVAELSRTKAAERVQREQSAEDELWKEEREAYEEKERQDVEQENEEKKKAPSIASSRGSSSIIHVDGSDTVNGNGGPTCAVDAGRSDSSQQLSPIIFANDPDPLPPPLQLPTSSTSGSSGQFHPPGLAHLHLDHAHGAHPDILEVAELQIASEMHERIARILRLFQERGVKHLVLGSFGTGVFQNSVELVAGIFKDLLCGRGKGEGFDGVVDSDGTASDKEKANDPEDVTEEDDDLTKTPTQAKARASVLSAAPFKDAFSTVAFAILGGSTVRTFQEVFEGEEGVELDEDGDESDVEAMKDLADVKKEDMASFAVDGRGDEKSESEQMTESEEMTELKEMTGSEEKTESEDQHESLESAAEADTTTTPGSSALTEPPTVDDSHPKPEDAPPGNPE